MKKVCLIATVPMTVRAFLIPMARYYRENTDWDISILCDQDPTLAANPGSWVKPFMDQP